MKKTGGRKSRDTLPLIIGLVKIANTDVPMLSLSVAHQNGMCGGAKSCL